MTPFDWLLFRRTLAVVLALAGVASAAVVTTGEATSTAAMRVARVAALEPLLAAVAVLAVVAHVTARGEARALASLGQGPFRSGRGAALAATVCAVVGAAVLLSPLSDATSLFPVVRASVAWAVDATRHVATAPSVTVLDDGSVALSLAAASFSETEPRALAALPCLTPLALSVGPWAVVPLPNGLRAAALGVSGALVVTALHLVAAHRVAPVVGVLTALPLAVTALGAARR